MMDPKKDTVAKLYQNFDEMTRSALVRYLEAERHTACTSSTTLEQIRSEAWTDYAQELGLEYHVDHLMQYGHGGYPYLYIVPADGGDTLCHVCATKSLKAGQVVGWSHHMEGDIEYCAECSAEVKPFVESPPQTVPWVITLTMQLLEGQDPSSFDWREMLDLGPGESCKIETRNGLSGELVTDEKLDGGPPSKDPEELEEEDNEPEERGDVLPTGWGWSV